VFWRRTPAFRGLYGRPVGGSVARLEMVRIGDHPQGVLLRGIDAAAPALLLLHDGPGEAQIGVARPTQSELEGAFVVANWDQRGAGLSYRRTLARQSLTIDSLVRDALEIARWVLAALGRERLVLAGAGWGSILGLLAARQAPELFEAYVGIGQVVDAAENERRLAGWVAAEAERLGRGSAIRDLAAAGGPPYRSPQSYRLVRRWAERLEDGVSARRPATAGGIARLDLQEYTLADLLRWRQGRRFSLETLAGPATTIDLTTRVTRVEVPTYFVFGRNDRVGDPQTAREFLRVLDAPRKGWAWIEEAGHQAPRTQPDALAAALAHFAADAKEPPAPSWGIAG
jgi:pimeloyl-ACP methyl ester carboxylesterase